MGEEGEEALQMWQDLTHYIQHVMADHTVPTATRKEGREREGGQQVETGREELDRLGI